MKGKWAAGIPPRNFIWIIKDRLALSERPGGFAASHRKVRRQEEIIWIKAQGFTRIVSLLSSPHNLESYDRFGVAWSNYPLDHAVVSPLVLEKCFSDLEEGLAGGSRILIHQDELSDRVMGVTAGFLVWSRRLPSAPQAIAIIEHVVGHPMGSPGRGLVMTADQIVKA